MHFSAYYEAVHRFPEIFVQKTLERPTHNLLSSGPNSGKTNARSVLVVAVSLHGFKGLKELLGSTVRAHVPWRQVNRLSTSQRLDGWLLHLDVEEA